MDIVREIRDVKKANTELHSGRNVQNVTCVLNNRGDLSPILQAFISIVVQNNVLK